MSMRDIVDALMGGLGNQGAGQGGAGYSPSPAASASIGGDSPVAPVMHDPGPAPVAQTPATPLGAPSAIPAAATLSPATKTQGDYTLPPVTMTPPPVAGAPFSPSTFRQPQQLPMLGDVLGAQPAVRRRYPMLSGGLGGGGVASGDY